MKKEPSFVPTPTDINWYAVRKDFTNFVNKIRHFADVSDQLAQQRQKLEVNPENIVSASTNVFPPGKPPPVCSDSKQLYKSKQSNNNSLELLYIPSKKKYLTQKTSERHTIALTKTRN